MPPSLRGGREVISKTEVETATNARFRLTPIIPTVENQKRCVCELTQEGRDEFFEDNRALAEFVVGVERI